MNVIGFVGSVYGDESHFVDYDPVVESDTGARFVLTCGGPVSLSKMDEEYVNFFKTSPSVSAGKDDRLLFVGEDFLTTLNLLVSMGVSEFDKHVTLFETWFDFQGFRWVVGSWPVFNSYSEVISSSAAEAVREGIDSNNQVQVRNALKLLSICFVEDEKSKLVLEIEGYEFLGDSYSANFMRTWLALCCS